MEAAKLRELLSRVKTGDVTVDDAVGELKDLPFADLGYAVVDHHRSLRQGVPEVILGEGKTTPQIVGIARELARMQRTVLITRIAADKAETVCAEIEGARHNPMARTITIECGPITPLSDGQVVVVTAGTSDMPVAEECGETLSALGVTHEKLFDVGVAGIHRILHKRTVLDGAAAVVVVAGMEGALASVVGGLVQVPVVAVPTSVGYGASLGGIAALLGMLTSCASGITVVNIDNGFGAAFAVARMLRASARVTTP